MQKPVLGDDGKGLVYSDDFSSDKLELQWQWYDHPVDDALVAHRAQGLAPPEMSRIVVLTSSWLLIPSVPVPKDQPAKGIIKTDVSKMKDGDVAGLSAFQGDAALLSIVKEGKKLFVVGTKESVAFH